MSGRSKAKNRIQTPGRLSAFWIVLFVILPVIVAIIALAFGRFKITPAEVLDILKRALSAQIDFLKMSTKETTILKVRLPRVLLACLIGAGLSVSGCTFQSLFANPLATPDTVGVASGASFGAALGILLGLPLWGIQICAFASGLAAVALTWLLGYGRDRSLNGVVLAGIMIGALFSALVSLVKFAADSETQLPAITYFLMGSLTSASFDTLLFGAVPIILCMAVLFLLRWRMNLLPFSEDEVRSFGVNMRLLRAVSTVAATMITSACVAMCGQVGWIGLLVPHMCRMKFKNNHMSLIPACISTGAAFMVIVDTLARSLTAAEIPVSVLTAIIGAPFFIYLMKKSGGWQL